jgi:hypothetical protein
VAYSFLQGKLSAATDDNVTLDSTSVGSTLIVLSIAGEGLGTPTDTYSNTWVQIATTSDYNDTGLYYCKNPSVGSSHNFDSNTTRGGIGVLCFDGSVPAGEIIDVHMHLYSDGTSTFAQGQGATVAEDDELLVWNLGFSRYVGSRPDGTVTAENQDAFWYYANNGTNCSIFHAYQIQTAKANVAAYHPYTTWTSGARCVGVGAFFKLGAGGGGGTTVGWGSLLSQSRNRAVYA